MLVKDIRGVPRIEPRTSRTLSENHTTRQAANYVSDYACSLVKRKTKLCVGKDIRGVPGIETRTSRTLSKNHTTRPSSQLRKRLCK